MLECFGMEITPEILRQIMPTLSKEKRELYAPMLNVSMAEFRINNERRVAAYLANLAHESMNLTRWEENLRYSAKRLMQVWPSRFPTISSTASFANNPENLANKVYGGRMGNDKHGDGWKYRGRFPIQCTGKDLYQRASIFLDLPQLYSHPDSCMKDPMIGFRVSAWIFALEKGGNKLADNLQIKALTKAINGGYNGLQERIDLFNRGLRILPDDFELTPGTRSFREDTRVPDYVEGAEIEEEEEEEVSKEIKEPTSSSGDSKENPAGTLPPAEAKEVKASQVDWWSKITALSIPTGAGAIITGIASFAKSIPPQGWIALGIFATAAMIIGFLIWRDKNRAADERTKIVMDAAADKGKNDLRLI